MSSIQRTYLFSDGTTWFNSQAEAEISNIVKTWNNHDQGILSWTALKVTGNTLLSGTLTVTGVSTLNGQLIAKGTATNDNAAAGYIGEIISSSNTAYNTNFPTSGQYGDATSISLTAGDWDVDLQIIGDSNGATWSRMDIGISTTSGNSSTGLLVADNYLTELWTNSSTTVQFKCLTIASYRVSLNSTTTHYAKALSNYTAGTPKINSFRLSARRRR